VYWGTEYSANFVAKITQLMGNEISAVFIYILLPSKNKSVLKLLERCFVCEINQVCELN